MKLKIRITNLPFMPLNRAKMLARGFLVKTDLCREFEKDLEERMIDYQAEAFEFAAVVQNDCHIKISYRLYCPKSEYFTKKGEISSKCPDADSIKVLQDTIFRSLGMDDKYIKDLHILMLPSSDDFWNYAIDLETVANDVLYV